MSATSNKWQLTKREYEVMQLLAHEGKSVKGAAEVLFISPNTVSTYFSRVKEKMKVSTRHAACMLFLRDMLKADIEYESWGK